MDTELRPLSLGEVLDRTFQLYRGHFMMFVGIAMLPAAIDLVWKLIQTTATRSITGHVATTTLGFVNFGLSLVNALVYVIVGAVALAATCRAVSSIYLGQSTSMGQAYGEVKPHWLRYVWLYTVAGAIAWGGVLFAIVAAVAAAAAGARTVGTSTLVFMVVGLSMIVLVPFGIWMTLRYSLANTACVFEDLGIRTSLKRSVYLAKGAGEKMKIFTLLFMAWVISIVLAWGALTPLLMMVFRAAAHNKVFAASLGMTIYTLLVGFVVSSLTTPIYAIGLTLFYYDARIRKEGFDVEWMMQRVSGVPLAALDEVVAPVPPVEPSLG